MDPVLVVPNAKCFKGLDTSRPVLDARTYRRRICCSCNYGDSTLHKSSTVRLLDMTLHLEKFTDFPRFVRFLSYVFEVVYFTGCLKWFPALVS